MTVLPPRGMKFSGYTTDDGECMVRTVPLEPGDLDPYVDHEEFLKWKNGLPSEWSGKEMFGETCFQYASPRYGNPFGYTKE